MNNTTDTNNEPVQKRVVGAGGRLRTVWECPIHGCWMGSYGAAVKHIAKATK